jgi:hypothetical protein
MVGAQKLLGREQKPLTKGQKLRLVLLEVSFLNDFRPNLKNLNLINLHNSKKSKNWRQNEVQYCMG